MHNRTGDVILVNGNVLTGTYEQTNATGVAVINGRIVELGSDDDVLGWRRGNTEVIDLAGRTVTPGLNDAHCHPMGVGFSLAEVDASSPPNRTVADIVERIKHRVGMTPAREWVIASGYDQARLEDLRHPTSADLDPISPDNPVLVLRACHHIGVANSLALQAAGIDANTPDPDGGTIDRDEHGNPTGVVREAALHLVRRVIPEPTVEQYKEALIAAGHDFLSKGVTSVAEAGIGDPRELLAYQELALEAELPVRTYLMMMIDDTLDELSALGIKTGFGDEWLRVGPAKLFLDGSIGGRTARMSQPYVDEAENVGLWMQDPETMKAKLIKAHQAGFQCCAHAIGDAAISLLLDAYEEAQRIAPREDPRHRIEHCSIIDMPIIERIQRLGAIPIPGTSFLYYFSQAYLQNLGRDRIRYSYAMNTFYEHGIVAAASTDAPVVNTSAAIGMQSMMTRVSEEGDDVWAEEIVPLTEALRAYTYNGAYASFEENIKGTIEPGKLGDLTVFETNLNNVEAENFGKLNVDLTISGGQVVYHREGAAR